MSDPRQTCLTCGEYETVVPDGRGFPPDIAKRRLAKRCKAAGHSSRPQYTAGFSVRGVVPDLIADINEALKVRRG